MIDRTTTHIAADEAADASRQWDFAPPFTARITEHDMFNPDPGLGSDVVRDLLTMCFSLPVCDGFLTWGFSDQRSWVGNAPFYFSNYTEKPATAVYRDLLFNQWFTRGATGTTGSDGSVSIKVWQGIHNVTVAA